MYKPKNYDESPFKDSINVVKDASAPLNTRDSWEEGSLLPVFSNDCVQLPLPPLPQLSTIIRAVFMIVVCNFYSYFCDLTYSCYLYIGAFVVCSGAHCIPSSWPYCLPIMRKWGRQCSCNGTADRNNIQVRKATLID